MIAKYPRHILKASVAALLLVFAGWLAYTVIPKPTLTAFQPYSKAFYSANGELLRIRLAEDDKYRLHTPIDNISNELINATILYEDQHYYRHNGVDFTALLRAAWQTYVIKTRRIGASTLPMQVARLRWQITSNTLWGKCQQIARAIQLSRHYSKGEILSAYLNLAPYGGNIEGVGAASLIYFNKPASSLNLNEALSLAVIPQNPSKRNPSKVDGYQQLQNAKQRLAKRYKKYYPQDTTDLGSLLMPLHVRAVSRLPNTAPHFTQYVHQQLPAYHNGVINTTLDTNKQALSERVVRDYIAQHQRLDINNAAAIVVNAKTMAVEVMVGSADFNNPRIQGQVNGTNAKRSPGSTLKPFVYGLAMDNGLIHPLTLLADVPKQYGGFSPENYDQKFLGPLNATQALILSRNVPAVTLQAKLTTTNFHQFLKQAGVKALKSPEHYGLALALGGGEVTMTELVTLYAMLLNHGVYQPIISHEEPHAEPLDLPKKHLLSAESSFLLVDMLSQNPPPKSHENLKFAKKNRNVAWKTGTSWAFRDAWAVAVTGDHVIAVWVGNFDGKGNPTFIGSTAAGPLLFQLIDTILPNDQWSVNDLRQSRVHNLQQVPICHASGNLMQKHCPAEILGWFIPGVSPITHQTIFKQIQIDPVTKLRACPNTIQNTVSKVYAFWPSEFMQLFRQAGIAISPPPAYAPDCKVNDRKIQGNAPVFTSPAYGLEYVHSPTQALLLHANHDADVRQLYWFVDNNYLGTSTENQGYYWATKPGKHVVTVVDDNGRSASRVLTVNMLPE